MEMVFFKPVLCVVPIPFLSQVSSEGERQKILFAHQDPSSSLSGATVFLSSDRSNMAESGNLLETP